jgi:hypothetical protein
MIHSIDARTKNLRFQVVQFRDSGLIIHNSIRARTKNLRFQVVCVHLDDQFRQQPVASPFSYHAPGSLSLEPTSSCAENLVRFNRGIEICTVKDRTACKHDDMIVLNVERVKKVRRKRLHIRRII